MDAEERSLLGKIASRATTYSSAEMDTACHWTKQAVALGVGVASGVMPLQGMQPMLTFLVLSLLCTYATYSLLLRANPDGEAQIELLKEGMMPATALFLLTWIVLFTLMHT